jgi:hypothetical protein
MFTIILFTLVALICGFFIIKLGIRDGEIFSSLGIVVPLWIGLSMFAYLPLKFEGLYRGYSVGERTGYITKMAEKGIIFKTIEGQIQAGTGNMSALQEPFDFTIRKSRPDLIVLADSVRTNSIKIKLHYIQWYIMPIYIGDSGYEVDRIEVLE